MSESVFAQYIPAAWPHRFNGRLHLASVAGGTPSDPNVAQGWIASKTKGRDDLVRDMVAEIMAERGVTMEEATEFADKLKHLNGFKRGAATDEGHEGELYIDGRCLKAGIKEAASVARAADKLGARWGTTNKGILGFVAEHIQVVTERLWLGVTEPSDVIQSFPKNARTGQTGIQYTEICTDVSVDFTVISDWNFSAKEWALLWLTAEQQGLGATRSQGMGRYAVTAWNQVAAA